MRRRILIVAALIALLAFVPPLINLSRFQTRIAQTLSGSIGRKVTFSDVRLRILPRPAFVFANLVVAEDPAFGMEPMLSSPQVTAAIRLSSLWRGRMEIARLSFDSPSLNLVRNDRGRWNIGGSLQQAATVPSAPTANVRPGPAPRFPYVEVSDARVNFKLGAVKQAFSLTDSDLSLWLESANHWEMRLVATPLRTDAYLADTGRIRASATFLREHAEAIEDTPLKADIRWENAQLGQATWLLTGQDRGWRGNLDLRTRVEGTSKQLHLTSRLSIDSFRRYNISVPDEMNVRLECAADLVRKSTAQDMRFSAESGDCTLPVGDGAIRLAGRASLADRTYDVQVLADKVPLQSFMNFYRRAKLNVSDSLSATGTVRSDLRFSASSPCVSGTAEIEAGRFVDAVRAVSLNVGNLALQSIGSRKSNRSGGNVDGCLSSTIAAVDLGGKLPLNMRVDVQTSGMRVAMNGQAESEKLLATAKSFGLLARDYHAQGILNVDAALNIDPRGFKAPQWFGSVRSDALNFPQGLALRQVALAFNGDNVALQRFAVTLRDLDTELSGAVTWPLRCDAPPCPVQFALHATALDVDTINRAVNPSFRKRNWFYLPRFLGGSEAKLSPMSILFVFKGSGSVAIDHFTIRKLRIDSVTADAMWDQNRLVLSNVSGRTLGGTIVATTDLAASPFALSGKARLRDVDLASTAPLVGTAWARGRGDLDGAFSFAGSTPKDIGESLRANFQFSAQNGTLKNFAESGDLAFRDWSGKGAVHDRRLEIMESTVTSAITVQSLTGTVRPDFTLDLRLQGASAGTLIGGSLAAPQVRSAPSQAETASNRTNAPSPAKPAR